MLNYLIIPEKKLILMCFAGQVGPEDVINFIDKMVSDPLYNKNYNSLIDLRNTELLYNIQGLKMVLKHMAMREDFAGKRKSAYITSSANQVVPPMMMNSDQYKFPMEVKVLSSVELAIEYLRIQDFTEEDYEDLIKGMCDC